MKFGYYPGCSLASSSKEYDMSLKAALKVLDVELEELNDWSCCGATSAHVTNHLLGSALAMRNIGIAGNHGLESLFAPCAACYNRLVVTQHDVISHPGLAKDMEEIIPGSTSKRVKVMSVLEMFNAVGVDSIRAKVKRELKEITAACYYGCLLVRPAGITGFDDAERPESMEKLVEATGARTVDWNFKVECCGAAHSVARRDIVVDLSKKILDDAVAHGANVVIVACPMCHTNLDMRQRVMKRKFEGHRFVPVLYLSELIGLSFGIGKKELGIDLHYVDFGSGEKIANKMTAG